MTHSLVVMFCRFFFFVVWLFIIIEIWILFIGSVYMQKISTMEQFCFYLDLKCSRVHKIFWMVCFWFQYTINQVIIEWCVMLLELVWQHNLACTFIPHSILNICRSINSKVFFFVVVSVRVKWQYHFLFFIWISKAVRHNLWIYANAIIFS